MYTQRSTFCYKTVGNIHNDNIQLQNYNTRNIINRNRLRYEIFIF